MSGCLDFPPGRGQGLVGTGTKMDQDLGLILRSQRHADLCELEASLVYRMSSKTANVARILSSVQLANCKKQLGPRSGVLLEGL